MSYFFKSLALALMLTPATMNFAAAQSVEGPAGSTMIVSVSQNRELTGMITELDEINVTTSFGEVKVPMAKIDGIKMNIGNDKGAVLAFKNGDMLSGKINLDKIQLKTDWASLTSMRIRLKRSPTTRTLVSSTITRLVEQDGGLPKLAPFLLVKLPHAVGSKSR